VSTKESPALWYVQLRCPASLNWITVAIAQNRAQAAARAGVYFHQYLCDDERQATSVRIRMDAELAREPDGLERAHETLAREVSRLAAA
jgi:hypothetical protein